MVTPAHPHRRSPWMAVGDDPYRRSMETNAAAVVRWEYLTAPLLIHNTKMILDNFGRDGWELVTVLTGATSENLVAYFKRPVR